MSPTPPSARRLRALVAPSGRRPNPPTAPWQLQRRHAEGGDWWTILESTDRDVLRDEVTGPLVPPDYGDLVRLLSPNGATRGFWVQGRRGLLDAGTVPAPLGPYGLDWERAWEGPQADPLNLLSDARAVDPKRLAGAACDAAEAVLGHVREGETRPREAVETARRGLRGLASPRELRRAAEAAGDAATEAGRSDASDPEADDDAFEAYDADNAATNAALEAAFAVFEPDRAGPRAWVTFREAGRLLEQEELAALVRRWIPLPIALLGRAGEPTPLSLGF